MLYDRKLTAFYERLCAPTTRLRPIPPLTSHYLSQIFFCEEIAVNRSTRNASIVFSALLLFTGRAHAALPHLEGNIIFPGNSLWDYTPSWMVDQFDGNREKIWWCSQSEGVDVIRYSVRLPGGIWSGPKIVFQHTPSAPAWEGVFVCDPSVVRGSFAIRLVPNGALQDFSYAMYYTTNDPISNGNPDNNRVGVAFSNNGVDWQRYHNYVIYRKPNQNAYGTGQQVAFSASGGAGVNLIYTFVESYNKISYYYSQSADAVTFSNPSLVSTNGLTVNGSPGIALRSPALAFAPSFDGKDYHFFLANVCETYGDVTGEPKRICTYRLPMTKLSQGTWERIINPGDVKPVQFEPGFRADAWGWLSGALRQPVTLGMGCTGSYSETSSYELCFASAVP